MPRPLSVGNLRGGGGCTTAKTKVDMHSEEPRPTQGEFKTLDDESVSQGNVLLRIVYVFKVGLIMIYK